MAVYIIIFTIIFLIAFIGFVINLFKYFKATKPIYKRAYMIWIISNILLLIVFGIFILQFLNN
ncbi:hypothetical protein GCM10007203_16270 [Staphylococcus nepalensis]|nr:hypothetical protein CD130_13915 [Staphylococcus nepalensis]GGB85776.1 hypothetical protein GCM10007203_16270 [Staphylococcus nepalensis]